MQISFQLGRPKLLGFTDTRQKIWDSDWAGAGTEMRKSKWYREDTPERAKRMVDAFKDDDASGFRQANDPYEGG